MIKSGIRRILNASGLDIVRVSSSPRRSLLGLVNFPIRSIIDIGANEGQFARLIRGFFPQATLYCFEPLPVPYQALSRWAATQPAGNVRTYNMALGDTDGDASMYCHSDHTASSSFLSTTTTAAHLYPFVQRQESVNVALRSLDSLFPQPETDLESEILVKLDVQGYEDRVLRGGAAVFKCSRACIVEINLDRLYEGQAEFKEVLSLLSDFGYRYRGNLDQTYAPDGHVVFADMVFVNLDLQQRARL